MVPALLALGALTTACESAVGPTYLVYVDRPVSTVGVDRGWRAVSVGGQHSCGIRTSGVLYCWGSNGEDQLGVGVARGRCGIRRTPCEATPRPVASDHRFTAVSAGARHSCALTTDDTVYCWGASDEFQTGVEATVRVAVPTPVLPGLRFRQLSAGGSHSCAVRTNGVVYCWGEGRLGALGSGDTLTRVMPSPLSTSEQFLAVSAGQWRSCAISARDASVWCWGAEWESSSGAVDIYHARLQPVRIDEAPPAREVSAGATSICSVALDLSTRCWQSNTHAQLGTASAAGSARPARVDTPHPFLSVSTGIVQSCALARDGRAYCWGNDSFGQLGIPRTGESCGLAALECSRRPAAVFGDLRFAAVTTGFGSHSCGLTVEGAVFCWGLGTDGQLGDGFTRVRQSLPVAVRAPIP